ncbi:hypothetical protein C823_002605 [Eubacterium plexicaudatum ASF492]|uniref:DUF979 domain-containing protein n=1 Tax=Eubacterium plexicaudatum ASF492 TaxID=1235802 RepID=N2A872_9FIRM|nr:hypothetical protein C823_002605 [Eubacterium plexicaudatum ASF492]
MSFFMDPEVAMSNKLMEIIYLFIGFMVVYTAFKNLRDKENPNRIGTFVFWFLLGILLAFGRFLPDAFSGVLVLIMCVPAILHKVKKGKTDAPTKADTQAAYEAIGMKIFIPALSIGVFAVGAALTTKTLGFSALNGVAIGVFVAAALLMAFNRKTTPVTLLNDSERMLSTVGPLSMLPMLLACLGAVFTAAGVGDVVASLVERIIPAGNVDVGIIVYALGMMLFTMIMGNAFAAITVMTVGIGAPFVLSYGANPVAVGMLALTCGFCGTLCTPMAANFNTVPVALLDMKKQFGVIKNQVLIAFIMVIVQIVMMIMLK